MTLPFGTITGGLYGEHRSAADKKRQERLMQEALASLQGVQAPTADQLRYNVEDIRNTYGNLPEEQNINVDPSQMQGISLDPALRDAQYQALAGFGKAARGEYSPIEQARQAKIQADIDQRARGAREAIMQNMHRRGMGGSGLELAANLSNQQAAASQANMGGLQTEAQAQQRALEGLGNYGKMAGGMQSEDFGRQAQIASAQDAINKFNTQNSIGMQQRNIAAQQGRQEASQKIASANALQRNQAAKENAQTPLDAWKAQQVRAQALSQGQQGLGGFYGKSAQDTQRKYTGMGQSWDAYQQQNENNFMDMMSMLYGGGSTGKGGSKQGNPNAGINLTGDDENKMGNYA